MSSKNQVVDLITPPGSPTPVQAPGAPFRYTFKSDAMKLYSDSEDEIEDYEEVESGIINEADWYKYEMSDAWMSLPHDLIARVGGYLDHVAFEINRKRSVVAVRGRISKTDPRREVINKFALEHVDFWNDDPNILLMWDRISHGVEYPLITDISIILW